jgi:Rieske Fe-S protein
MPISHLTTDPTGGARPLGHAHFAERVLSRRSFLGRSAGVAGAALTSAAWMPALAQADRSPATAAPTPIPPNPNLFGFRVNFPVEGNEPSTIFDLNGFIGVTEIQGTGTATLADGSTQRLFFDVDNRFMTGEYVGLDGRLHHGTFGFV